MDFVFKVIPNANYHIKEVLINGVPATPTNAPNEYTIHSISRNTMVQVSFEIDKYTVDLVQPSEGGSITFNGGNGNNSFEHGSSATMTFLQIQIID